MKTPKKLKAFRLKKQSIIELRHMAKITGKSMTRILEEAIGEKCKLQKEAA